MSIEIAKNEKITSKNKKNSSNAQRKIRKIAANHSRNIKILR